MSLLLSGLLFGFGANAKEREDYTFLITIAPYDGGKEEIIYADQYELMGIVKIESELVDGRRMDTCRRYMRLAVKNTDGAVYDHRSDGKLLSKYNNWIIAPNDKISVLHQETKKLSTVKMRDCPEPSILIFE